MGGHRVIMQVKMKTKTVIGPTPTSFAAKDGKALPFFKNCPSKKLNISKRDYNENDDAPNDKNKIIASTVDKPVHKGCAPGSILSQKI